MNNTFIERGALANVTPLIQLATIKEHLRVDGNYEDDLITSYYYASVQLCADYIHKAIEEYTFTYRERGTVSYAAKDFIKLQRGLIRSITSVAYVKDNVQTNVLSTQYSVFNDGIYLLIDISADQLVIVFNAGMTTTNISYAVRSAVLLLIGTLYNSRENENERQTYELNTNVRTLLAGERDYIV